MTNGEIVTTGAFGMTASFGAWLLTKAAEITPLLQDISLIVGITLGVLSIIKLARKKNEN
jgi:F0F1-type ATP synthase assembly protein I